MATAHADYGTKSDHRHGHDTARRSPVEVVKLVASGVVLLALVLFAVVNSDEVQVDYLVGNAGVPLIFVILGSAVAGALVAALIRHRRS
jgi:uncharacterized integral membrane protein